ncbi:MAG TPA: hypothetical protein VMC09_16695 [Anaerolineales bacterium]|nr:hypothetical protein [Anaerolineales bacterium]
MRITRDALIRIAKETAQKRAYAEPGLVAAYLTGSLRTENPFLGNSTDIDLVLVHAEEPKARREIVAVSPEVHLDIHHNLRSEYDKPKELRVHPWLGPELYDPQPLYVTQHFFEFVQAGVRDKFHEPVSVLARARRVAGNARQTWNDLQTSQASGPELVLAYLTCIHLAANAVALLTDYPLPERRFLLQFPARAGAVGQPGLAQQLLSLLGADRVSAGALAGFLPDWEKSFLEAANNPIVEKRIAAPRLGYYKLAFESLLSSETPQAVVWPLMLTWTIAVCILPPMWKVRWRSACELLGLDGGPFDEKVASLDHFIDAIDDLLEKTASSQGL